MTSSRHPGIGAARVAWRRFAQDERGFASIEFVLLTPLALAIALSSIELGVLMLRQMMLDYAVDSVVRGVRLGAYANVIDDASTTDRNELHDRLVEDICARSIIPSCQANLRLEMNSTALRAWTGIPPNANCVDRTETGTPVLNVRQGGENELVILRACALYDPLFPTNVLSRAVVVDSRTYYALISTNAFVIEPRS